MPHVIRWLLLVSSTRRIVFEVSTILPYEFCTAADFTAMPDLQYAASQNDVMIGLRDHVLPARCKRSSKSMQFRTDYGSDADLKKYSINTAAGADLTKSVGPSAEFLQMPIAFNYK